MKRNSLATVIIAASIASAPVAPAMGDDLGAGIAGAIIGGLIVNEAMKQKQHRVVHTNAGVYSAARQERRNVQTALNYFNFPAGAPDGVYGRRTRTAVSNYQYYMGYPATGALLPYQQDFLLTSYQRAQMGGQMTMQQIATNPQGSRGLLLSYRDEMMGKTNGATTAGTPSDSGTPSTTTGGDTTTAATFASMPSFGTATQTSLTSNCNKVSLLTNANGGFARASAMPDAAFALNEQFCLARTYAIADSEDLTSKMQGYSTAQVEANCAGVVEPMRDLIGAVSLQPRADVVAKTSSFILKTGMSPAQLMATARICLGVGYRTDNMDIAVASGLLLVSLGKPVYAELIGHHLNQGIGTSQRADLAADWYGAAIDALDNGAQAVFAPQQSDRPALLRAAVAQSGGIGGAQTTGGASIIPVFKISE